MTKDIKLLPEGFCDLIFEEAAQKHHNKNKVIDYFLAKGFALVETSLVEFDDKSDFSANSFITFDAKSGKNLAFRKDITPQIERLLNSRLANQKLPLKLCYQGEVLVNNSTDNQRQKTQSGIEIIGDSSEEADFNIIYTALEAVQKLGYKNILIEFSLPDLLDKFFDEAGIIDNVRSNLSDAILSKNISKIREIIGDKIKVIEDIILDNSNLEKNINRFLSEFNSKTLAAEFDRAKRINSALENSFNGEICFDLFGDHKSLYHNAISFDIFVDSKSLPIAKGGRYKIADKDAVGATLYI